MIIPVVRPYKASPAEIIVSFAVIAFVHLTNDVYGIAIH